MESLRFLLGHRRGFAFDGVEEQGGGEKVRAASGREAERAKSKIEVAESPASGGRFAASRGDHGSGSVLHGTKRRPSSSIEYAGIRESGHDPEQRIQTGGHFGHSGEAFRSKDGQADPDDMRESGNGFVSSSGYSVFLRNQSAVRAFDGSVLIFM
jgi:hypothetical protein